MVQEKADSVDKYHIEDTAEAPQAYDAELHGWVGINDEARAAAAGEHRLGLRAAIKLYPKAVFWSFVVSLVVIMEGYDTNLLGAFFAFPPFTQQFGSQLPDGQYQVSAGWQMSLMNGAQVGSLIGLALNGILCDKLGYKKTYFISLAMMTAFIFLPFFATSPSLLLAGQILSGIPWGMFQTLSGASNMDKSRSSEVLMHLFINMEYIIIVQSVNR